MTRKYLPQDILDLIGKHSRALSEDSMDNQYHHLILLESLVKVGLSEVSIPQDLKDKSS